MGTYTFHSLKNHRNNDLTNINQKLISENKSNYETLLSLGQDLKSRKKFKDAKEVFQKIFENHPEKPQGLRGLIQVSQHDNDWAQVIKLTSILINKFPEVSQGYWSKGHAYLKLKNYEKADKEFQLLYTLFPSKQLGLIGLIKVAQENKDWQLVVDLTEKFIKTFSDTWQEYWLDTNIKNKMHLEYIRALLNVGKVDKAENVASQFLVNSSDSISAHYALILINQKRQKFHESFHHFELSIDYTNNGLIKKDLILLSKVTFMKLRFFSEYEALIDELINDFPNRTDVLLAWLELPALGMPLIKSWEMDIQKLKKILDKKPNHIKFLDTYASLLLSTERLEEADKFLYEQIKRRPNHLGLNRKYCICAHHKQEWVEAEKRFEIFYRSFPADKSDTFFYYAHVLYKLNKTDKLQAEYKIFNSKRFKGIGNIDGLDELQSNLLLRNYEHVHDLENKTFSDSKDKNKFQHLYDEGNLSIKKVINAPTNDVLFICLGGIHEHAPKQYMLNNFEDTYYFDKIMNIKKDNHSFQGLANKTTQFNYILVNDFSSSYCLANKDVYLDKLKDVIKSIDHKYLVCIGSSAGAFSSIMIGQSLKANIVFAFMTRTQAFFSRTHKFYRDLQISSQLFKPDDIDIGYMQYKSGGFYPKVYMTLCEKEPLDIMSTYTLDKKDPNLHITYCHSDVHNVMKYLGAKNIYTEMTKIVERELKNRFELTIQTDIFKQLEGYKYNSQEGI